MHNRVPFVSNALDEYTRIWVMIYFMPFFIIGNGDKIKDIMKPMCFK